MIPPVRRVAMPLVVAVAVLFALPGVAAAGDRTGTPRIVGGAVSTNAWPAQGALRINGGFACGGSLVSGLWFVTAAHCVTIENTLGEDVGIRPASALTVRLGSSNKGSGGQILNVASVTRHGAYNHEESRNDIALLRLATVPSSTAIQPLRIVTADESALWAADEPATIIGWGCTIGTPTCSGTTVLHEADAPMRSDADCEDPSSYTPDLFDAETMVCAGDGNTDTCSGDSGGPLMVPRVDAWILVGITSWGFGCADPDFPGIYTRVGAPGLNAWLRDRVPTATISPSGLNDPGPDAGSNVPLQAIGDPGAHATPMPIFTWELDGDDKFDDAIGPTAQLNSISAGSHVVKVRQVYSDGDCAIAREVITTQGSTPPVPSNPAPLAAPFCPPKKVIIKPDEPDPPPPPPPPPLAELVSIPKKIKVRSLLDRKMVVRVRCRSGCYVESTLTLDARTSRRLRLTRRTGKTKRIASGDNEQFTQGTLRVTLRLSRSTVKRLRRARSGTLTLRVKATDDDEKLKFFKVRIKLRR